MHFDDVYVKVDTSMKLRTTTPASIGLKGRILLGLLAMLTAIAIPAQMMTKNVSADEYDDRISILQQEIEQFKAQSDRLNSEALTLQNALNVLNSEKQAIQTQINLSQAKHDKLVAEISANEKKIADNQDALGVTIANLYVGDNISPIEMLASSSNISEYLDKQEYRSSVRDELTSTIGKIKELKASLEKQRKEVGEILSNQKAQRSALVDKENEHKNLIDKTRGEEAEYKKLISDNQARQAETRAQQQEYLSRLYSNSGAQTISGGSSGGYPWNESNCQMGGELGMTGNLVYYSYGGANGSGGDGRGYGCRQCASYVAWRISKETGRYYSWGNATNFDSGGLSAGYQIGYTPKAGSVGVIKGAYGAPEGHVVWVESVDNNGTLTISQYNYNNQYPSPLGWGKYSKISGVSASTYNVYVYIK